MAQTNYARWIPAHLRNMVTLAIKHPSVYTHFLVRNYTGKKTTHALSVIGIDQVHGRNNALVKGDGELLALQRIHGISSVDGVESNDGHSDH